MKYYIFVTLSLELRYREMFNIVSQANFLYSGSRIDYYTAKTYHNLLLSDVSRDVGQKACG